MIDVRFESFGRGKCHWCQKERADVFGIKLRDNSFEGQMCWADLKCMIRLKVAPNGAGKPVIPTELDAASLPEGVEL